MTQRFIMTALETSTRSVPRSIAPKRLGIVRQFTPNWFATTMGTGILSIALGQFPGQSVVFGIGEALWLANMLLFAACSLA
ncbi:UNVERIFIED_CONTAM: hypothetical protein ODX46_01240, partial [Salmonella enterica subsp. enterica serovar Enteritidis]